MKKSIYTTMWQELKSKKGTINACLAEFVQIVADQPKNSTARKTFEGYIFEEIDGKLYPISVKTLNKRYYNRIKETFGIGQEKSVKKTVKGCETTYTYIRKCSVFDIYRFFYSLSKEANK